MEIKGRETSQTKSFAIYALLLIAFLAGAAVLLTILFALVSSRSLIALVILLAALKGIHKLNGDSWDGILGARRD